MAHSFHSWAGLITSIENYRKFPRLQLFNRLQVEALYDDTHCEKLSISSRSRSQSVLQIRFNVAGVKSNPKLFNEFDFPASIVRSMRRLAA